MKTINIVLLVILIIIAVASILYLILAPQYKSNFNTNSNKIINPKYKYKLVIVAIFKNEAVAMREWLQHYMRQGVGHFYMINNGSTDNWEKEIEDFPVTIISDDKKYNQIEHYNNYFLEKVKRNAEWVMAVDLDEFMYARKGHNTIPEYLDTVDKDIGQFKVRMKNFGSNGHIKQPKSIINSFTMREKGANKPNDSPKSLVRTICLTSFHIHIHKISSKYKQLFIPHNIDEESLQKSYLHLNHYRIQSWDWYNNVKMTRGDVSTINKDFNKKYNHAHFKSLDFNDVEDKELSNNIHKAPNNYRKGKPQISRDKLRVSFIKIMKILNNSKLDNWVIVYGTLLGLIRDNDVIDQDDDIDIAILQEDRKFIKSIMNGKNFILKIDHKDILQFKDIDTNVLIDFYVLESMEQANTYCIKWENFPMKLFPIQKKIFRDTIVNIPQDSISFLSNWYSNWKVPVNEKGLSHQRPLCNKNYKVLHRPDLI